MGEVAATGDCRRSPPSLRSEAGAVANAAAAIRGIEARRTDRGAAAAGAQASFVLALRGLQARKLLGGGIELGAERRALFAWEAAARADAHAVASRAASGAAFAASATFGAFAASAASATGAALSFDGAGAAAGVLTGSNRRVALARRLTGAAQAWSGSHASPAGNREQQANRQ
jgi:hypothetical protein